MKNCLRCFFFMLVIASFARADARLYASDDGSAVKLQWHPITWATDEIGFVLKRRVVSAGATASWENLHADVLRPSVNYLRDWSLLGFNEAQSLAINEHIKSKKYDQRKMLNEQEVLTIFRQTPEFDPRARVSMIRDATRAFAYDLGYIDNTTKRGADYEYGLFEVREGGAESTQPVAVRRPINPTRLKDWPQIAGVTFVPEINPDRFEVRWRMPMAQAEALAVFNFQVERRGDAQADWTLISNEELYVPNKSKTDVQWAFKEDVTSALPKPPLHYRLTPVNMFQVKLPSAEYTIDSLVPDPDDHALFGPSALKGKIENGKLHLTWTQKATQWRGNPLNGFYLHARSAGRSKFPLWLNSARQAEIDVSELGADKEFWLEAVYVDWDESEFFMGSKEVLNLDSLR